LNAELIGAAIFVVGVIFAAGKFVNSVTEGYKQEIAALRQRYETEHAQTKLDVNRLGSKFRDLEKAAARKHHNICEVIIATQKSKKDRFKIAGLLKED
jgi:hypothetical protein